MTKGERERCIQRHMLRGDECDLLGAQTPGTVAWLEPQIKVRCVVAVVLRAVKRVAREVSSCTRPVGCARPEPKHIKGTHGCFEPTEHLEEVGATTAASSEDSCKRSLETHGRSKCREQSCTAEVRSARLEKGQEQSKTLGTLSLCTWKTASSEEEVRFQGSPSACGREPSLRTVTLRSAHCTKSSTGDSCTLLHRPIP